MLVAVLVVLLNGLFINLQNFGIDQSFVQRYHAVRSEKEAQRSLWIGSLLYLPAAVQGQAQEWVDNYRALMGLIEAVCEVNREVLRTLGRTAALEAKARRSRR